MFTTPVPPAVIRRFWPVLLTMRNAFGTGLKSTPNEVPSRASKPVLMRRRDPSGRVDLIDRADAAVVADADEHAGSRRTEVDADQAAGHAGDRHVAQEWSRASCCRN